MELYGAKRGKIDLHLVGMDLTLLEEGNGKEMELESWRETKSGIEHCVSFLEFLKNWVP